MSIILETGAARARLWTAAAPVGSAEDRITMRPQADNTAASNASCQLQQLTCCMTGRDAPAESYNSQTIAWT